MDALIAIAPWQLERIPDVLRSHTAQIDNWTYPKIVSTDARRRLRQAYGISESDFLIGTLGRSEKSKGLDALIDAFVESKLSGCRLVLVGGGRDWQSLRRRAPASVVMPGYTSVPQDWLSAMDLFVSAARSEPFGLVFLEAMQAGLPILATASQGAQHLGDHFTYPLLPVGDIPAMTKAFRQLHAANPVRQHYDLSRFDGQQQVDRIEAFYKAEIARRHQHAQFI
jgi:glycosyltransferase involved in cell wall biosynthesis